MKKTIILMGAAIILFAAAGLTQQKDDPKCKDHPMFSRMPGGYWIHSCTEKDFDAFAFIIAKGKTESVEGHLWKIHYYPQAKAELKPESAAAVAEVAKLLKAEPGLKVFVVGHTDSAGSPESNLALSQNRAQSVMQSLIKDHGIEAGRIKAFGCGPYAPVATNDTEEGKAKNRRVELVKQ